MCPLLDGKGQRAEQDRAQQRRRQAGPHDQHAVFAVEALDQAGDAGGLDVEAVGGQVHDREIDRDRRHDVFLADLAGVSAQADLQATPGCAFAVGIAGLGGEQQPIVILDRELRIQRQQGAVGAAHRHDDGELDDLVAALDQLAVRLPATLREHVLQQRAQMHLAPGAALLDVGEDALEVADLRRDGLDVGHRLLHLAELVDHALEAAGHLLLDRRRQRFADGVLDRSEPLRRLLAHLAQLGLQQRASIALIADHDGGQRRQRPGQRPLAAGHQPARRLRIGPRLVDGVFQHVQHVVMPGGAAEL